MTGPRPPVREALRGLTSAAGTATLAAAVLAAALVVLGFRPPGDVGDLPAVAADVPSSVVVPQGLPDAPAPAGGEDPPSASAGTRDVADGAQAVDAAEAVDAPTRLRIGRLDVDAPVVEVGLTADGDLEVPDDVREVGWYGLGPAPGEPGSAVIAGHVDGRGQGPGALWDLRRLEPGDRFELDQGGETTRWEVVARRTYDKDELPIAELFTAEGPARLALITCGGAFDATSGSYADNVVVHAVPVA